MMQVSSFDFRLKKTKLIYWLVPPAGFRSSILDRRPSSFVFRLSSVRRRVFLLPVVVVS